MSQDSKPAPNTHLGEVHWWCDQFFGTHLFICQGYLGMGPHPETNTKFLDTEKLGISDLWDFFEEIELPNGRLGLYLFADRDWHTTILATIETTLPYGETVGDQAFLNLIADFKEHVRSLPLCDPEKREGALWTDEDIERGYSKKANREYIRALHQARKILREKGIFLQFGKKRGEDF